MWGYSLRPKKSHCIPSKVLRTTPGGPFLSVKNGPPDPPRTTKGRAFRLALPLESLPHRPKEGACGPPLLGTLPRLSYHREESRPAALRSSWAAQRTPRPLRSKAEGSSFDVRMAPGGFPKGRGRSPCPLVVLRGRPRGEIEIPPRGFFGGLGAFFAFKECPQKSSHLQR